MRLRLWYRGGQNRMDKQVLDKKNNYHIVLIKESGKVEYLEKVWIHEDKTGYKRATFICSNKREKAMIINSKSPNFTTYLNTCLDFPDTRSVDLEKICYN